MPYSPDRPVRSPGLARQQPAGFRLPAVLQWRRGSLLRGSALVLGSTLFAFRLSHFPNNHATLWLIAPLLLAVAGTGDTARCMQKQWNWYHGGVVLCVYMDLMAVCLIVFFLVYPIWL